jgi:hypothetical protein
MSYTTDRTIVVVVFLFYYVYLAFLRMQINSQRDWMNVKCNPLTMWTSSFVQSNEMAKHNFGKCITELSQQTLNAEVDAAKLQQAKALSKVAGLSSVISSTNKEVQSKTQDVKNNYNALNSNVKQLQSMQNAVASNNQTLSTNLGNFTTTMNNFFGDIRSYLPKLT